MSDLDQINQGEVATHNSDTTTTAAVEAPETAVSETPETAEITEPEILITRTAIMMANDHGVSPETAQLALDRFFAGSYGQASVAFETGTLIGAAAVHIPGASQWCVVEKVAAIATGPQGGPELWLEVYTGAQPVLVMMSDGEEEPRHYVPVPASLCRPVPPEFFGDWAPEAPCLCKSGEKLRKKAENAQNRKAGEAKRDKKAAKKAAGKKSPTPLVIEAGSIEVDGEEVPAFRMTAQHAAMQALTPGWEQIAAKHGATDDGWFHGPQAEDKCKAVARKVLRASGL